MRMTVFAVMLVMGLAVSTEAIAQNGGRPPPRPITPIFNAASGVRRPPPPPPTRFRGLTRTFNRAGGVPPRPRPNGLTRRFNDAARPPRR